MATPATSTTPQGSLVAEFVAQSGGNKVIERILIANNGIAAVKGIRSIRKWAYETFGNERAIEFTVMATPEDIKANADYIRMADNFVEVPGGTNNNNYANVNLIVELAERLGVQGVWAGWGHASENPRLPDSLGQTKSKIAFLGPPGSAMRALGDKISSTIVAQSAEVPCMPWSGSGLIVPCPTAGDRQVIADVPQDIYDKACVFDGEAALAAAERIGFPVMIKASEGGGGKGIRRAEHAEHFTALFQQVQAEVPGSPIFVMKLAGNARHLEVQVLADQYGQAISLFGRDCSVQRRHQKIIEEAPVSVCTPEKFVHMEAAAVRLAMLVGYSSVGTVEYLYMPEDGTFSFLELNPRLQVEHPTTEMVTGVNLPAAQLQVAMGIPLHRMKDIRVLYGLDPRGTSPIDFAFAKAGSLETQQRPKPKGHVIATRITAENPDQGFKPSSGAMQELNFRSSNNVWGYFSVGVSGGLHEFADSQFGHVFAYGENRQQARRNMVVALKEISIRGDFRTTVEYLIKLLETEAFEKNTFNTGWLDSLIRAKVTAERPDTSIAVICGALYRADQLCLERLEEYKRMVAKSASALHRGQSPSNDLLRTDSSVDIILDGVKYSFTTTQSGPQAYTLYLNGAAVEVNARKLSDGGLLIQLDGRSHVTYAKEEIASTLLLIDGKTCMLEKESDPTKLRSPSPGKLVRFVVEDGDHVDAGQPYAEVEVMKMYMPLTVTEAGNIRLIMQPGSVLESGALIAILTLDDPSRVRHARPFDGQLPKMGPPQSEDGKASSVFRASLRTLELVLAGYDRQNKVHESCKRLMEALHDPQLPFVELQELMAALESRLPNKLVAQMNALVKSASPSPNGESFPARALIKAIQEHADAMARLHTAWLQPSDRASLLGTIKPVTDMLERYKDGLKQHERSVIRNLITQYLSVEKLFGVEGRRAEDVIHELRALNKTDLDGVVAVALSHSKLANRNSLMLLLLDYVNSDRSSTGLEGFYTPVLKQMADLQGSKFAKVALRARGILVESLLPSYDDRLREMERVLASAVAISTLPLAVTPNSDSDDDNDLPTFGRRGPASPSPPPSALSRSRLPDVSKLTQIVETNLTVDDVLTPFFFNADRMVVLAALEVYVRRAYRAYDLRDVVHVLGDDAAAAGIALTEWRFRFPDHPNEHTSATEAAPMLRAFSVSDALFARSKDSGPSDQRIGVMVAAESMQQLRMVFTQLLERFPYRREPTDEDSEANVKPEAVDVINVALRPPTDTLDDETILRKHLIPFVDVRSRVTQLATPKTQEVKMLLRGRWIRRITFLIVRPQSMPAYFTFRERLDYQEDPVIRHVEPALAFQLELFRMSSFDVKASVLESRSLHLYYGTGKHNPSDGRFFVRADTMTRSPALIRPGLMQTSEAPVDYLVSEADRVISESLDALELKISLYPNSDCNQIFMNFIPTVRVTIPEIRETFKGFIERHGRRMARLRVAMGELKLNIRQAENSPAIPVRFVISNVTGVVLNVHAYKEVKNEKRQDIFVSVAERGPLHGQSVDTPYPTKEWLQPKRYSAHLSGTTYIYDFPELFRQGIHVLWQKHVAQFPTSVVPQVLMKAKELVLDEKDRLHEVWRPAGANTIGMVAWLMEFFTPEYPNGRKAIVIGNDITHVIGSFGPQEDRLFAKASELARKQGIPRIYISANSGARIGIAEELMAVFRVAWTNPENPSKGFKYLYLTPADYQLLVQGGKASVRATLTHDDGEDRYMITDIIGAADGIGVENLQGSGMIAGETSQAYRDIFTVTLVTCRSVGIGAYLVRLGALLSTSVSHTRARQRAVQNEGNPIILTGAGALNKVLGREVYSSNLQLGGTQIMYSNGVSHLTAKDDYSGVLAILNWLSFVPSQRDQLPPRMPTTDPLDRDVEWSPPRGPYDPRLLLTGQQDEKENRWLRGLMDVGSFVETLGGWAKTVVTGRARLHGIPIGVILVETRTVETVIPADPANPESQQQVLQQAGQVWYPDSAFKTAQAISDFNHGEQLPLMILANWRGFSGGQRDMFEEILKYGSYIVDAIHDYKQPLFIYLPPRAELRGGAWVVLDTTINADQVEMYADSGARGGVLEPEGTVEIKFRKAALIDTMQRIDPLCRSLKDSLDGKDLTPEARSELKIKLEQREKQLMPVYHQVAVQFADLHDTAGRMKEKNAIRAVVEWSQARRYFGERLRRREGEEAVIKAVAHQAPSFDRAHVLRLIKDWFSNDLPDGDWHNDTAVADWLVRADVEVRARVQALERDHITAVILREGERDKTAAINALLSLMKSLNPQDRNDLAAKLKAL